MSEKAFSFLLGAVFNLITYTKEDRRNIVRKLVLSALMVVVAAFSSFAMAEKKIATVDLNKAIGATEYAKSQMKAKEREKEFAANKKEYEGLLGEYDALIAKWEKNKAVMSDEKKRDAQKKIIDKENDIKYLTQKLQQAQQDMSRKILAELAQDVNKVVQTIVKEKGIGMLLRADGGIVLYVDPDMDITKAVTERLNQVKPK